MTPLVLVIVVVMWVLVLVPPLLRSRSDGRPNHSISSFQQQLRTLQRTSTVPARGSVTYLRTPAPEMARRAPSRVGRYPVEAAQDAFDDWYRAGNVPTVRNPYQAPLRQTQPSSRYAAAQREAVRRRRQNVLLTLLGAVFLSAVLGFGMGVSMMVWVCLAIAVALVLYVLLLVQMQRAAELRAYRSSWARIAA